MTQVPDQVFDDTDPRVSALYYALLGTLSPEKRYARLAQLNSFGRKVMVASIRAQHPDCSDQELRRHLAERLHGKEFVEQFLSK